MNSKEEEMLMRAIEDQRETTFRWGTRMLRGGTRTYSPCVLDQNEWENKYNIRPVDYDILNDPEWDLKRSTYHRLGDLGFSWPEPTTQEAMRTGVCGPDANSLTRPGILGRNDDRRPEPAYRLHLTNRTMLHHLRADPVEGVIPFGRQGDTSKEKSVSHRDFKWRQRCCCRPKDMPPKPCFSSFAYRAAKTDLNIPGNSYTGNLPNKVVKFQDDHLKDVWLESPLLRLKKAWKWPINTITREPLGGRLLYYDPDPCARSKNAVWPCGEKEFPECIPPYVIPEDRCDIMAHGRKKDDPAGERYRSYPTEGGHSASVMDLRFPRPNWECWEEVPEGCRGHVPCECCFGEGRVRDNPAMNKPPCPPPPPCPQIPRYPCKKL